jgi:hypothetical protein
MFVQWLFITLQAAPLRLLRQHIPEAASQMNEMKLNKFMIFVRYVCAQFRAFRSRSLPRANKALTP